jgi:hypothetical protein
MGSYWGLRSRLIRLCTGNVEISLL